MPKLSTARRQAFIKDVGFTPTYMERIHSKLLLLGNDGREFQIRGDRSYVDQYETAFNELLQPTANQRRRHSGTSFVCNVPKSSLPPDDDDDQDELDESESWEHDEQASLQRVPILKQPYDSLAGNADPYEEPLTMPVANAKDYTPSASPPCFFNLNYQQEINGELSALVGNAAAADEEPLVLPTWPAK